MPFDLLFFLATAAFGWGLSLATYRWFASHNDWPMGEWQAHRPGLPIAIGLFAIFIAMLFALARGGATLAIVPLCGLIAAIAWTGITRVGAQAALLLAPIAVLALVVAWTIAATMVDSAAYSRANLSLIGDRGIETGRQAAGIAAERRWTGPGSARRED